MIKDENGRIIETLKKKRLDTCARVGTEIWYQNPEVKNQIKLTTAKVYTNTVKVIILMILALMVIVNEYG